MCTSFRLDPAESARIRALIDEIFGKHPRPEQRVVQEELFDRDLRPNDLILTVGAEGLPGECADGPEDLSSDDADGVPVRLSDTGILGMPATVALMRWGFPGFRKGRPIVNARRETAAEKPLFAAALAARRCLVPATGFYEWDVAKKRYGFRLPDGDELYMAGFFSPYGDGLRCCILTTAPNASVAPIHDRMPVVLAREQLEPWLSDDDAVEGILAATPPELEAAPVPRTRKGSDGVAGSERSGGSRGNRQPGDSTGGEQPTLW